MSERIPKAQVDLEDLTVHGGAPVLLRRALAKLAAGGLLEVRGDSPELAEELAAWCRKEGHRYLGEDKGPNTYRIERGAGPASLMATGSDTAEVADPHWGLAPRGARIEAGGPEFAFTLRHKREGTVEHLQAGGRQSVVCRARHSLGQSSQAAGGGGSRSLPDHDVSHGE